VEAQSNIIKDMFDLVNKVYDERQILNEICLVFSSEFDCYVLVLDKTDKPLFESKCNSADLTSADEIFAKLTSGLDNIGSIIIKRQNALFNSCDKQAFYALASLVSLLIRFSNEQSEKNIRRVKAAVGSLSYSELTAALHVFDLLEGKSGHFISSNVSKEKGVAKSAIVNCLRKLESAGLIEVRSLGVKGTHVQVLNDALADELGKFKR